MSETFFKRFLRDQHDHRQGPDQQQAADPSLDPGHDDFPGHVRSKIDFWGCSVDDFLEKNVRLPFDYDHPGKSISRAALRTSHRREIITMLCRNAGVISPLLIQRFGMYCGVTIPLLDIEMFLKDERCFGMSGKKQVEDSDSEPDPDEDVKKKESTLSAKVSEQKLATIIWMIKRELQVFYQELLSKDLQSEQTTARQQQEPCVPSYKTPRPIAANQVEYLRMRSAKIFSRNGKIVDDSQGSPSVSFTLHSRLISDQDEVSSVQSTDCTVEHSELTDRASVTIQHEMPVHQDWIGSPKVDVNIVCQPEKDPCVFRYFYPAPIPPEVLELPIYTQKEQILKFLSSRRVIVIAGPTGTGKTTQVPLMALDECAAANRPCNIIVTQPRRLAATSIAKRVCVERGWTLGQLVGYHVGLDRQTTQSTRLTYCTTGVLLEKIISSKNLNMYTHVFLDEVHERDQDTDLALMLVRQMMRENSPEVQVILMSATLEVNKMSDYFEEKTAFRPWEEADVPGKVTLQIAHFEVKEVYLENFSDETTKKMEFDLGHPRLPRPLLQLASRAMDGLVPLPGCTVTDAGESVLMFLPGLEYILEMETLLKEKGDRSLDICILHSSINKEEQWRVAHDFPKRGVRRIILSTNIAESSLTLPFVNYVFDFCLTKSMRLNAYTKIPQLSLQWASQSSASQRKGRVGRKKPGVVYFFVPKSFWISALPKYPKPEVVEAPMENTVLRIKHLEVDIPPAELLVLLLDPPHQNDVELAIINLKSIGALTVTHQGKPCYDDGDLTQMGTLMASFPMDVRVARFMFLCIMFGYAYEGCIMAAGMTVESVLTRTRLSPADRQRVMEQCYYRAGVRCDALAILYAYEIWENQKDSLKSHVDRVKFTDSTLIDLSRMKELHVLKQELCGRLQRRGFAADQPSNMQVPKELIVPLLFTGAFYPNVMVNIAQYVDVKMEKVLNGYDPLCTLVIPNFGHQTAVQGPLYDADLKAILRANFRTGTALPKIIYGNFSTFVCFDRATQGRAEDMHPELGAMLKMLAHTRGILTVPEHDPSPDLKKYICDADPCNSDADFRFCIQEYPSPRHGIPPCQVIFQTGLRFGVTMLEVDAVDKFFLSCVNDEVLQQQKDLDAAFTVLTNEKKLFGVDREQIQLGEAYIANNPMEDNKPVCTRAIVLSPVTSEGEVAVLLVDEGMIDLIPASSLYYLPRRLSDIPRSCFEFSFVGLRFLKNQKRIALDYMHSLLCVESGLSVEVYSVVDGVVHGDLFWKCPLLTDVEINVGDEFVRLGYAFHGKESWFSEYYHHKWVGSDDVELPKGAEHVREEKVAVTFATGKKISVGPIEAPAQTRRVTVTKHQKNVTAVGTSLNSTAYEKYPQDDGWPYRPVVAAFLQHPSHSEDHLKASITSQLPMQPGLLAILSLAFSSRAEIIEKDGEYVGALTGLGPAADSTDSFYPEGNVHLVFDGYVSDGDIDKVNALRAKLNQMLRTAHGNVRAVHDIDELQNECLNLLVSLANKPRMLRPNQGFWNAFAWSPIVYDREWLIAEGNFLVPVGKPSQPPASQKLIELHDHIVTLHRDAFRLLKRKQSVSEDEFTKELPVGLSVGRCLFCEKAINRTDFLEHVFSLAHIEQENRQLMKPE